MESKTEIVQTKTKSPSELIEFALKNKGNLLELEKLLEIQIKYEANEARKVFASSFAKVQRDIEAVVKTKTNNQTHSKYAELGDIIEATKPVYTQEGFSVIFYEGECPKEGQIRMFADVLHSAGHKETYYLDMPLDGVGIKGNANMTAIHGKKSAVTYSRNTLMCMIWNIPMADDDGNASTVKSTLSDKEIEELNRIIQEKNLNVKKLCEFMAVEDIKQIKSAEYKKALAAVKAAPAL